MTRRTDGSPFSLHCAYGEHEGCVMATCPCRCHGRRHKSGLTCIHAKLGLCRECSADYDCDPIAWEEFGNHKAGLERYERLRQEMLDVGEQARREREMQADFEAAMNDEERKFHREAFEGIPF